MASSQEKLQQAEAEDAGLPPPAGWRKAFSALRNPNYRYFYSGQSVSLIGTWTRTAALGWIAFQFTHSEFLLGIVFMLNSLPIFLFAVYAGSLADRIPKIRIFTLTSWFSLLSSLTLAVMLFRGPVHIAYLMVFAVLWGLSMTFEMPARQTLMVELVGKKDLVNAIALNSAMVNSSPRHRSRYWRSFAGFLRGRLVLPSGCHELFGGSLRHSQNPASRIALRAQEGKSRLEIYFGRIQIFKNQSHHRPGGDPAFHHGTGRLGLPIPTLRLRGHPIEDGRPRLWLAPGPEWPRRLYRGFVRRRARHPASCAFNTLYAGAGIYAAFIILFGFMHQPVGAAFLLFFAGYRHHPVFFHRQQHHPNPIAGSSAGTG